MNWKFWQSADGESRLGTIGKASATLIVLYLVAVLLVGFWWDHEPDPFDPVSDARERADAAGHDVVTGYTTTATLMRLAETILDKRGGYLSNDVFPPGVWMDNVPNWEFGVLVQIRDMSRAFRVDFSRSQSQSAEDPDLSEAEGKFFWDSSSWILPRTEDQYREGIKYLRRYAERLVDPAQSQAQFYARADNLRNWLTGVETRLGSLSQRLSASVGKRQLNIDLAGDTSATQATDAPQDTEVKTGWTKIDDVFFEARGQTWALLHMLKAVHRDFEAVVDDKNALVSLQQIIRELEATQESIWSPVIMNGSGFGLVANHSLVMASYISRANAGLSDLRALLAQG